MIEPNTPAVPNLALADIGARWRILQVTAPPESPQWAQWLEEVGFIPGESVQVISRSLMPGGPLVVRVGQSTFALRMDEAACVHLENRP